MNNVKNSLRLVNVDMQNLNFVLELKFPQHFVAEHNLGSTVQISNHDVNSALVRGGES